MHLYRKMQEYLHNVNASFAKLNSYFCRCQSIKTQKQSMKKGKKQDSMGDGLAHEFRAELPLLRDPNGLFCLTAQINGQQADTFFLDTKATSMARMEELNALHATYWDKYLNMRVWDRMERWV